MATPQQRIQHLNMSAIRMNMGGGASETPRACNNIKPPEIARLYQYGSRYSSVTDPRVNGSTETKIKAEVDGLDRHELFLLAEGEKKIEYETVTRKDTPT